MNNFDKFLDELGIEQPKDGQDILIEIENSDDYSRFYTRLDSSEFVKLDESKSVMNTDNAILVYIGDGFIAKLFGNLDKDVYRLTIEKDKAE